VTVRLWRGHRDTRWQAQAPLLHHCRRPADPQGGPARSRSALARAFADPQMAAVLASIVGIVALALAARIDPARMLRE
jgi:hypothetical protein